MDNPFEAILKLLNLHRISYQIIEHEPVYTCEEAAKIRGLPAALGTKTLMIKTRTGNILCVMPGDRRLDSKKLKKLLNVSELSFAKPEAVEELMGCAIGACYPFGNLIQVRTIVDPALKTGESLYFNPGRHDRTLIMKTSDYLSLVPHEIAEISQ